ncbi:MAG: MBL fold metallo-hydrolase [Desulfobacter sp.]|nr:MBL fold metallo-hydrolase [Desulfobacter sp.]
MGTAGFKIRTQEACFLIDPFLSRNRQASPSQTLRPSDLKTASHIFISHGHFDHIMDVPTIAEKTGACVVCSPTAAHTLSDMGLARIGRKLPDFFPLLVNFPCGQVLSWQFEIQNKRLLFFGSAGSTAKELQRLKSTPCDILFLPLQGHSKICEKALAYVEALGPGCVIPHHQDDFFPPLSRTVDITPFTDQVAKAFPGIEVRPMGLNETLVL